ncbi:MAG: tRNA (guanosine(37)-N1)-methyltransferase TrmD [Bacteroidetes bacterium]|nr:tRNA (guanosine(37)-N1)-methyltransferase TrmD [Bacteroidota bacterium]
MRIDILSAVPDLLTGPFEGSIVGRARAQGLVDIRVHDIRDFSSDRHRKIDDYPFGGGSGMVLTAQPIVDCFEALDDSESIDEVIFLTPDGLPLKQNVVNELSLKRRLVLLAGHYKGVDQRVRDLIVTREISIGDYVLSGGELPAAVLTDAIVRLIPGVLGDATSALEDSFQDGLLDGPAYTRPAEFRGLAVPEVLRSGDHARIQEWFEAERVKKTRIRRPDLLSGQD